jgi:phage-related protein
MEWKTIAYTTTNGKCPIREYLFSLDTDQRAKVAAVIETIEEIGFHEALGRTKFIKKLEDKIFEIRVEWKSNIFRVFTFTLVGKNIVLTHGFTKKTQKTP